MIAPQRPRPFWLGSVKRVCKKRSLTNADEKPAFTSSCFHGSFKKNATGNGMFVLRSLFWLSTVVLLLPPSEDGRDPAPRVSVIHAAYAAKVLLQDMTGVCERNPDACAVSREAMVLLGRKLETGAGIVSAGIAAGRGEDNSDVDHGTLTTADLAPAWSAARRKPAK